MTVLFTGGGPAMGLFKTLPDKDEFRVGLGPDTDEVAVYRVVERLRHAPTRKTFAAARFVGFRPSSSSLIDFYVGE